MVLLKSEGLTKYYQRLTRELRVVYQLPELHKVEEVLGRKHVQLVRASALGEGWKMVEEDGKILLFQQYLNLLKMGVVTHLLPQLLANYNTKIRYHYFFTPFEMEGVMQAFTLKGFSSPVHQNYSSSLAQEEERLSKIMSRKIRELYGKGPTKLNIICLSENYLVMEMEGLFGPFLQEYLQKANPENTDVFKALANHALKELCREELNVSVKCFSQVELSENMVVTLAMKKDALDHQVLK